MPFLYNKVLTKSNLNFYYHKHSWWQIMRPLTLSGTISPIIIGTFVASKFGIIHFDRFIVLILASVLIQAGVNILNDYYDFANGQDNEKWNFSIKNNKIFSKPKHNYLPFVALIMFSFASLLGLWLAIHSHLIIILIGALGIFAGYKYSAGGKQSFSALGLGEATAAIFLGFIPVSLAFIVQNIKFEFVGFTIGFLFALLISLMILTNNIRDIYKDEGFRQTIAIRIGKKQAIKLLIVLIIGVYLIGTLLVVSEILPVSSLIFYFAMPVAFRLVHVFITNDLQEKNVNVMKLVAKHHWVFSLLIILGLLISCLLNI